MGLESVPKVAVMGIKRRVRWRIVEAAASVVVENFSVANRNGLDEWEYGRVVHP